MFINFIFYLCAILIQKKILRLLILLLSLKFFLHILQLDK